jgi:hypothetical protein
MWVEAYSIEKEVAPQFSKKVTHYVGGGYTPPCLFGKASAHIVGKMGMVKRVW